MNRYYKDVAMLLLIDIADAYELKDFKMLFRRIKKAINWLNSK